MDVIDIYNLVENKVEKQHAGSLNKLSKKSGLSYKRYWSYRQAKGNVKLDKLIDVLKSLNLEIQIRDIV